ncbi:MAG TPA: hypothetical protein VMB71_13335 [Acetobacteraceae bacterium]|nr:hypothetical protein [Acetobacteraceae bacterium]
MSGNTTTTDKPLPTPVKNAYFTYTGSHRDPQQIWNVDGITIQVQGTTPSECHATAKATFFAKKHLLTFTGGKQKSAGDKGAKILAHRTTGDKPAKYGNTVLRGDDAASSCVVCDDMTPEALKKAFADALKGVTGKKKIATVTFATDCVVTYGNAGETSRSNTFQVQFWVNSTKTNYVLIHYHTH